MGTLFETLRNLGPLRLALMGGVVVVLFGIFFFILSRYANPELGLLYGELNEQDSAQIVSELEQRNIPYSIGEDGAAISVPKDQVLRLRLSLAEQGLPTGGAVGYELFDKTDSLGTTDFLQNVSLVRAQEGELARTIGALQQVQLARVHLVLPKRELFSRQSREASASVVLRMKNNARLGEEQILAIQQLVASSVPKLTPQRVSIVDDKGTLLARGFEDEGTRANSLEKRRLEHESRIARTIEALLEKTIGVGKVRAEVSAEMNFDRVTTTEEEFDPDSQVVRSTLTIEEQAQGQDTEPDPVTVGNNLPDPTNELRGGGATSSSSESRTEETVNYEISKKIVSRTRETGIIDRLSIGILVDGIYEVDGQGVRTYKARDDAELEAIARLARSAVGFDPDRGDTIEVVNLQFTDIMEEEEAAPTLYWGFSTDEIKHLVESLVILIVAGLFIMLVVRPVFSRFFETVGVTPEGDVALLTASADGTPALTGPEGVPMAPDQMPLEDDLEELIDIDRVEGRVKASSVRTVGEIVEQHPEEALSIIRNWMYEDG